MLSHRGRCISTAFGTENMALRRDGRGGSYSIHASVFFMCMYLGFTWHLGSSGGCGGGAKIYPKVEEASARAGGGRTSA